MVMLPSTAPEDRLCRCPTACSVHHNAYSGPTITPMSEFQDREHPHGVATIDRSVCETWQRFQQRMRHGIIIGTWAGAGINTWGAAGHDTAWGSGISPHAGWRESTILHPSPHFYPIPFAAAPEPSQHKYTHIHISRANQGIVSLTWRWNSNINTLRHDHAIHCTYKVGSLSI